MKKSRGLVLCAAVMVSALFPFLGSGAVQAATVAGGGQIEELTVSPDLSCGVLLKDYGQAFYAGDGCGTVVAGHGTTYRPANFSVGNPSTRTASWTAGEQTVSGAGTTASPYVITSTAVGWGLQVTQVDRFIKGETSFTTTISVTNTAGSATRLQIYRLGDCDFRATRAAYGEYDNVASLVTCRAPLADGSYSSRTQGIQLGGSGANYLFGTYNDIWAAVDAKSMFTDSIGTGSTRAVDGVLGLSWERQLEAGQTVSVTARSVFQAELPNPPAPTQSQGNSGGSSGTVSGSNNWNSSGRWNEGSGETSDPAATETPSASPTETPSPSPTATTTTPQPEPSPTATPTSSGDDNSQGNNANFWVSGGLGVIVIFGAIALVLLRRHGNPG